MTDYEEMQRLRDLAENMRNVNNPVDRYFAEKLADCNKRRKEAIMRAAKLTAYNA